MSIHGIDVSEFQGNVNWTQIKSQGIQFAMLRAGYGSGSIDPQFRKNAEECNRVGIPCGVYWFSYAYTPEMARREAEFCIETIEEFEISYPVCIDFEYASVRYAQSVGVTITRELATEIVEAFCSRVEELGYFAMYYSNLDYLNRYFAASLRPKYALWYAQYASAPDASGQAIWQYRDDGRLEGISGNVDMNIAYYDLASVISKAKLNHLDREHKTPEATAKPNDVIVYTIRSGDTLSEIAERYGTTYQRIAAYNGIRNANLIYAGQKIRIPLGAK